MAVVNKLYFWIPFLAWLVWLHKSNVSVTRPIPEFDVERSIVLHNRIVQIGLDALPEKMRNRVKTQVNWFSVHNVTDPLSLRLTPLLIAFLSNITIVLDSDQLSFLPHLQGTPDPIWLRDETIVRVEDRFNRYDPNMKLSKGLFSYPAEDDSVLIYKHPDPETYGIAMDLKTHLCAFATQDRPNYVEGDDVSSEEAIGMPLQDILEEYLWRIEKGKLYVNVAAAEQSIMEGGDPVGANGWRIAPWTTYDMQRTLSNWNILTTLIANQTTTTLNSRNPSFRQMETILDKTTASDLTGYPSFAREFLALARRPPFQFIAPGLSIPEAAFYQSAHSSFEQHFHEQANKYMWTFGDSPYSSILLFPAAKLGINFADESGMDLWHRFGWLIEDRPGLYLRGEDTEGHGSHLLLPFGLPLDVRKERPLGSSKDRSNVALYQQKRCGHGLDQYTAPLWEVFSQWATLVESREWTVGKDGGQRRNREVEGCRKRPENSNVRN